MRAIKLPFLRAVLSVALGCFVWLSAASARADGIFPPPPVFLPPTYDVSGALLIVGNDACSGLPCTETIAFSFDYGYATFSGEPGYYAYVSNLLATGSGALPFAENFVGPGFLNPNEGVFLGLGYPVAEFDIFFADFFVLTPVAPVLSVGDLYACETSTCITDFAPFPGGRGGSPPEVGLFVFGPVVATVTAIPEPATLSLLACGLLALGLAGTTRKVFPRGCRRHVKLPAYRTPSQPLLPQPGHLAGENQFSWTA